MAHVAGGALIFVLTALIGLTGFCLVTGSYAGVAILGGSAVAVGIFMMWINSGQRS
jgi:hypothetical protein